MGKPINNPFASSPEIKFGLSPDPGITRPYVGNREDGNGDRMAPQRPVRQWAQRPQTASGQHNTGGRGRTVPQEAVPAGGPRPVVPHEHSNMRQPAAGDTSSQISGHGMRPKDRVPRPDSKKAVPAKDPNRAGNRGQAESRTDTANAVTAVAGGLKLDFSAENLMRGFIMSEVLGRPKCMRRGRW
jgi:hypothetical protein